MQARWRFALAVAVLAALMTGPFVLTAVMVWADTPASAATSPIEGTRGRSARRCVLAMTRH